MSNAGQGQRSVSVAPTPEREKDISITLRELEAGFQSVVQLNERLARLHGQLYGPISTEEKSKQPERLFQSGAVGEVQRITDQIQRQLGNAHEIIGMIERLA
jgi:hypothetical protein